MAESSDKPDNTSGSKSGHKPGSKSEMAVNLTGKASSSGPAPVDVSPGELDNKPSSKSTSGGRGIFSALLSIILLAGICVVGYFVYEQDKAVNVLFEQQNTVNSRGDQASEQVEQLQSRVQGLADEVADIEALRNQIATTRLEVLAQTQQQIQELARQQEAEVVRLQNELVSTRLRITATNPGASQQWLLAEAASLLRLAQQQLIAARSVRTAQALFIAADDVLKQIDDPAVFSVREILAGELATLRAVPEVDIQEIYLQLGSVSNQLTGLQVTSDLTAQLADGERVTLFNQSETAETGWLTELFSSLKNLMSRFLVIRRRDQPVQALMTPGQEAALLQTVRLQIEQGRTALLKEEQEIYTASLSQARDSIDQYLSGDAGIKTRILSILDDLSGRRIVTEAPILIRSRTALEQILMTAEQLSTSDENQQ